MLRHEGHLLSSSATSTKMEGMRRSLRDTAARSRRDRRCGVSGASEVDPNRVQRAGRGDVQVVALGSAEREVGYDLRKVQLADQRSVRVEAVNAVVGSRPDATGVIEADAVERAGVAAGEDLPAGQRGVVGYVEAADVLVQGIYDVELALVDGEGQA